jgi:hypothetical protein
MMISSFLEKLVHFSVSRRVNGTLVMTYLHPIDVDQWSFLFCLSVVSEYNNRQISEIKY